MSGKNFGASRCVRKAALALGVSCGLCGWGGLCPAVLANTTAAAAATDPQQLAQVSQESRPGERYRLARDALQMPQAPERPPAASWTRDDALDTRIPDASPFSDRQPSSQFQAVMPAPRLRMALLLPLRSSTLKSAAEMVRDGFKAAHLRDGAGIDLDVIETDDGAQNIVAAYRTAAATHDVLIGPLSRSAVGALAASGVVDRPTIALAQPESAADGSGILPPHMLVMGLSIEEEARQAAAWAARENGASKALVVSTSVTWQKRAARAFINRWQRSGAPADVIELSVSGSFLNGAALAQLKKRLQADPPAFLFVALDEAQTRQLRAAVDPGLVLYGTSQLNSLNLAEVAGAEKRPELDGVRLLDLPWQLQADHPAVMVYPHAVTTGAARRIPDLERLYALGIDAFRVAAEIGAGHGRFTIDGVTGRLTVQFDAIGPAFFERLEQPAIYTDGVVLPVATGP